MMNYNERAKDALEKVLRQHYDMPVAASRLAAWTPQKRDVLSFEAKSGTGKRASGHCIVYENFVSVFVSDFDGESIDANYFVDNDGTIRPQSETMEPTIVSRPQ